jgi:hypothetical protein
MDERILILSYDVALVTSVSGQVWAINRNQPHRDRPSALRSGVAGPPSQSCGAASEHEKREKHTCPMHPDVVMDYPSHCPKCGIKLVSMPKRNTHAQRTIISPICRIRPTKGTSTQLRPPLARQRGVNMTSTWKCILPSISPML